MYKLEDMKVSDAELDQFITAHGMSICTRDQSRISILSGIVHWFEQCNSAIFAQMTQLRCFMSACLQSINGEHLNAEMHDMLCCSPFLLSVF